MVFLMERESVIALRGVYSYCHFEVQSIQRRCSSVRIRSPSVSWSNRNSPRSSAFQVQSSKEKDDLRGAEVIEDYAEAHKPAKEDSFVKETLGLTTKMKEEIQKLI